MNRDLLNDVKFESKVKVPERKASEPKPEKPRNEILLYVVRILLIVTTVSLILIGAQAGCVGIFSFMGGTPTTMEEINRTAEQMFKGE